MEQLKSWLRERHQLAVAVYSTGAADAILARNGLSIVDFLRPLSLVNQLNVPMRVGEFSMRVQEVQLGLFAGKSMHQPKPEVIDEALRLLLTVQAQQHATLQAVPNLIQHVQTEPPEVTSPWFHSYQAEFLRLVRFTEHETLDHPAAGLFFMPASTTQPLAVASKLLADAPLPLHASQAMLPPGDSLFAKHWVLLQDVGAPDMDDARALNNLATLSNTYGAANCSILRLHGSATGAAASAAATVAPAIFQACRHATLPGGGAGEPEQRPPEPPGGLGQGLHPDDMAAAGALLREFAERSLLPKVEERMARLNLAVSTARKGFKNRLTRLWKGAAAEPGPSMETSYPYHSIEGQMRALADLAYLLGQYEFAVQSYRLAAQDYLAAPNSRWYAGAEEMIGLCSVLTSDPSADPLKYFNRAYEHYSKVRGRQGRMLATRTMLYAAAYQAATGRHHAASVCLMRAHFDEEAARAALLLEAAAYCLLRCRPASVRKAAFNLVLAGLRYHSAKQKRLSIHCYKQVTGIYSASAWRHISEHLHDILGKQCSELGDAQGCLQHSTALLDCSHRQAAAQAHYLGRFLDAVQAAGVAGPVPGLALPLVVTDDVLVGFADQHCYPPNTPASLLPGSSSSGAAAAAAAAGDMEVASGESAAAVWRQLELAVAGGEAPSTNWLDGAKQVHDGEEFNTVAADEEIAIQVTFRNPLAIKLSLSHVKLQVQFTPAAAGSGGTGAATDAAAAAGPPRQDEVVVVESQFSLHPGEQLTESLLLRPLAAGWLRVTGVAWLLGGVAQGAAELDVKGRRRKKPKGDRPSQRKHYPPCKRLVFHVLHGMPRLAVTLDGLPAEAAAGELLRLQAQLRNVGSLPAGNLKVAVSSAGVALAGAAARQQDAAAAAAAAAGSTDVWQELLGAHDVITPARSRNAGHRRHQSSGAALTARAAAAAAAGSSSKRPATSDGSSSAASAGEQQQQQQQQQQQEQHMPHVLSNPLVHEGAVAAAAAAGGAAGGQADAAAQAAVFGIGAPGLVLEPGQTLSVPMWVHVQQQPGRFVFQCAWYCEPQEPVSTMRHRVLLSHHSLAVAPLLELAAPSVSPCVTDLHCYNLRLQAHTSKEAPGTVLLRQISCLSAGADAGWRLRSFGASSNDSSSSTNHLPGDAAAGDLQQSLAPALRLAAGEGCSHCVKLLSPAAVSPADSSSSSSSNHQGLLPVLQGPVHYFYQRGTAAGLAGSAGVGSSSATAAVLQQPLPLLPRETLQQQLRPLVSEPPVDVLLMWQLEPQSLGLHPSGLTPPHQQQQQQRSRAGFISFYDLCAAQQLNPVRMTLEGPGLLVPHKHDFRAASLCILPLTLKLRNCGTAAVSLTVRASGAWEGLAADHAWWAAPDAPGSKHSGLLGSSSVAGAGDISGWVGQAPPGSPAATALAQQVAQLGPLATGAAGFAGGGMGPPGLHSTPRTPQSATAAAAAAGLSGGMVGGAGDGLGAVFSGLGVRGLSPLCDTAGSDVLCGYAQQPAAAAGAQSLAAGDHVAAAVQAGLPPSAEHVWCGAACVPVRQLAPGGAAEVVLQVAVFKPGVFALDDYGVDWRCEGPPGPGGRVRQGSKVGEAIVLKVESV